jgi:serine/threonine protein kinase
MDAAVFFVMYVTLSCTRFIESIMFESQEPAAKVKVLDFGLSKKFIPGTRSIIRDSVGTVYTMSPQVLNGAYNAKADCWYVFGQLWISWRIFVHPQSRLVLF